MVPLFAPPPIEHPEIPIQLAAVNPFMCRIAGEVADGIRAHPVCTPRYIEEVMLPAARKGAAKTGRDFTDVRDSGDAADRDRAEQAPAWRAGARCAGADRVLCLDADLSDRLRVQGYGEVARTLQGYCAGAALGRDAGLVSDAMLDAYAVIGSYDEIAAKLRARYGGLATALDFAIPLSDAGDEAVLRGLIAGLREG